MSENEVIEVEVKDKVAPTIKVKIDEIGNSAAKADSKVDGLTRSQLQLAKAQAQFASAQSRQTIAQNQALASMQKLVAAEQASAVAKSRSAAEAAKATREIHRSAEAYTKAASAALKYEQAQKRANGSSTRSPGVVGNFARGIVSGGGHRHGGALPSSVQGALASMAIDSSPAVLGLTAIATALVSTSAAVIKFADNYNGLQNSLKNATGSFEGNGLLLRELGDIANSTGKPIDSVVEGFARFDRTLKPLGKTQKESLEFTRILNQALFTYGKSSGEAASATLQLSQAMGKGKLDGDEFRSVMENLPELGTAIAKELGVARGELVKLAPQGKITSEVIFNAMQRVKDQIAGLPEPIVRLDTAFTTFRNNFTLWIGSLEEANGGVIANFIKQIMGAAKALGYLADQQARANLLNKNFTDKDQIKSFLGFDGLTPDLQRQIELQVNEVYDAFSKLAQARAKRRETVNMRTVFNLEENDRLLRDIDYDIAKFEDAALGRLTSAKDFVDQLKASQTKAIADGEAMNKKFKESHELQKKMNDELAERRRIAGMSEEDQFVENELKAFKAAGLTNEQLAIQRQQLHEIYQLEHKREEKITDYIGHVQKLIALGKEVPNDIFQKAIEQSEKNQIDLGGPAGLSDSEDRELNKMLGINIDDPKPKKRRNPNEVTAQDEIKAVEKLIKQAGQETMFSKERIELTAYTYGEIDKLRQRDVISERKAADLRQKIWKNDLNDKMNLAQNFFSNFEGLQRSKSKEVAAIGKAAAVASATIDTYRAANAAYAAMAGIPVVGPGLGAVAAGAAIASGLVNVSNILSEPTGFKSGGWTGSAPRDQAVGIVHGQEYVMNAQATARIGRHNLDRMQSGQPVESQEPSTAQFTIVVLNSEEAAREFMMSAEGKKLIINTVASEPQTIKMALG